jgi:hypothetical protein
MFFMAENYYICVRVTFSNLSVAVYFYILVIVNISAMSRGGKMSLKHADFVSFGCIPIRGISGSYHSYILRFF